VGRSGWWLRSDDDDGWGGDRQGGEHKGTEAA
jgi:hypothetical protein